MNDTITKIVGAPSSLTSVNLAKELLREQLTTNKLLDAEIELNKLYLRKAEPLQSKAERLKGFGFQDYTNGIAKAKETINTLTLQKAVTGIFSGREIFEVAKKYRLRFLPNTHYKGDVPEELADIILSEIQADSGKNLLKLGYEDEYFSRGAKNRPSIFILAPAESFELEERPKDPLCFLELKDGRYKLIHKWGSDISVLRAIKYWPLQDMSNWVLTILVGFLLFAAAFIYSNMKLDLMDSPGTGLTTILSGVGAVVFVMYLLIERPAQFSDDVWNSLYKR